MKIFFFLFIIYNSFSITAQNSDIIGTWNYESIYEKEKLKEKEVKMVNEMFSDLTFYFKKEGNYISVGMGKVEEGTWKLDSDKKLIELTAANGRSNELEIIDLKENILIIKYAKMSLVLKKQK